MSHLNRPFAVLCTLALAIFAAGCGAPLQPSPEQQLRSALETFRQKPPEKAFAIGYRRNGLWVAAWYFGGSDLESAKSEALAGCERKSVEAGEPIECRVLYENDSLITSSSRSPGATGTLRPRQAAPPGSSSPPERSPPAQEPVLSTGSGTFVSGEGLVLTAEHVIRGARRIEVLTRDGRRAEARVVSSSRSLDLAVLATDLATGSYFPIRLVKPAAGTRVFTVGYPVPGILGQQPKVSEGIVSSESGIRDDAGFMQISIPIQPGNSGGPVVTEDGRLVGVVTSSAAIAPFLRTTGAVPQNVNWAVFSSLAVTMLGREGREAAPIGREAAIARAVAASVLVVAEIVPGTSPSAP